MATTLNFEYPLGSGKFLSVPPSVFQQISSGYRISLAQSYYLDIPLDLLVYTDRGFYPPYELLEDVNKPKFLLLQEGTYVHSVDPLEDYIGPTNINVMQERRFQVLAVDSITSSQLQLNIPFGSFQTQDEPTVVFTCALLQDPCGIKYVLPVSVDL